MPARDQFPAIFAQLKEILQPFAARLIVAADTPEHYALHAPASARYPRGLFVGAVQVRQRYVSYHLMPVYVFPDLLEGVPEPVRRRMQGKSCFNFTKLDQTTVDALARLTAAGFERYAREQLVEAATA